MQNFAKELEKWYHKNKRPLPWRDNKDPYKIWLSEVMSQQTTIAAVLPYYKRFIQVYPDLSAFALADLGDILKLWTGLGYPSRAANMHKAAKIVHQFGYPNTFEGWLVLPGVGPYTAAAISSMAFGQKKGVVDGNVIRVCSRYQGEPYEYWLPKGRRLIQDLMDVWIQTANDPAIFNQALMELGAMVCARVNPTCCHCPLMSNCQANKLNQIDYLPAKKTKKKVQQWLVIMEVSEYQNCYRVQKQSQSAPFLKSQWLFPNTLKTIKVKPKNYDYIHIITHNKIFVKVVTKAAKKSDTLKDRWWTRDQLLSVSPFSILIKAIELAAKRKAPSLSSKQKRWGSQRWSVKALKGVSG